MTGNRFRNPYRELTDDEKAHIERIKAAAALLEGIIEEALPIDGPKPLGHIVVREKALALTHLEDSVMRAVRGITA